MSDTLPLLQVRNLCKHFPLKHGEVLKAVDGMSFDLQAGQTLGIVGESGSGKTTAVRCILRALAPTSGSALFHNKGKTTDLATIPERSIKPLRREMQMIFQDPYSSLNPRMTVGEIIAEPLVIHRIGNRKQRTEQVNDMLQRVGLLPEHAGRYPHAFSGGQRQRVGIARALILNPALVVADECVSALDVSVRARVLALLRDLQTKMHLTYIFVSHDLSVIRRVCDHVLVMYKGRVMEQAPTARLFADPRHAYTRVLLSAIPYPDPDRPLRPLRVADLSPADLEPLGT